VARTVTDILPPPDTPHGSAAESWAREHARRILHGHAGIVAAAIRRTATKRGLSPDQRRNADAYWIFHLTQEQQRIHNAHYLDGVIPGA
jgi:hypothetical protein